MMSLPRAILSWITWRVVECMAGRRYKEMQRVNAMMAQVPSHLIRWWYLAAGGLPECSTKPVPPCPNMSLPVAVLFLKLDLSPSSCGKGVADVSSCKLLFRDFGQSEPSTNLVSAFAFPELAIHDIWPRRWGILQKVRDSFVDTQLYAHKQGSRMFQESHLGTHVQTKGVYLYDSWGDKVVGTGWVRRHEGGRCLEDGSQGRRSEKIREI